MDYGKWVPWLSLGIASLALFRSFRQDRKLAKEVIRLDSEVVTHIPGTVFYGLKISLTNTGFPDVMILKPRFSDVSEHRKNPSLEDVSSTPPWNDVSFPLLLKRGQQVDAFYRLADVDNWVDGSGSVVRFIVSVRTTLGGYAGAHTPYLDLPVLLRREETQLTAHQTDHPSLES